MRMRNQTVLAGVLATLLLSGCGDLLSLHGLYTDSDRLFEPAIEGRWQNENDRLAVVREGDVYELTLQSVSNPSHESKFELRLVDIKGVRFADIIPSDGFGHMFLKVQLTDGRLRVAFFDSEWLRQRVPHEEADETSGHKQAVLTARTPELRNIVGKYAAEPKAFGEEIIFRRP